MSSHWCPICGRRRLEGYVDPVAGDLELQCPACYPIFAFQQTHICARPALIDGREGLSEAYEHVLVTASQYLYQALEDGAARCFFCGHPAHLARTVPPGAQLDPFVWPGAHVHCSCCGRSASGSVSGLLLGLPDMLTFLRNHPQLRTLPSRPLDLDGRAAIVIRYQSMTDTSDTTTRAVLVDRERLTILDMQDEASEPLAG